MARKPGEVRDAIIAYLGSAGGKATVEQIHSAVERRLGGSVARSSVRSYLRLNEGKTFVRTGRGEYRLVRKGR